MTSGRGVDASIKLDRVGMVYQTTSGPVEALRDISLTVEQGEFISLVGPSGCGKSTLLRIIAGLRLATAGEVTVNGVDGGKTDHQRRHGVSGAGAAQMANDPRQRFVAGGACRSATAQLSAARLRSAAACGLGGISLRKRPNELSGGMQQRASICRALLLDPPLLLMDEPFGALDAMTRDDMNFELLRIWGEGRGLRGRRKTIVFVTHSIQEAVFLSDRVVVMCQRPGTITAVRDIDLPRPRTIETRASEDLGRLSLEIYRALNRRMV